MKTTTRYKIFETNSSSSHSISISDEVQLLTSLSPNEYGEIEISPGDFGWEWKKFNDPYTKISYCYTGCKDNSINELIMLKEVVEEHTGAICSFIEVKNDFYGIDHESAGLYKQVMSSKEKLKNFIFNPDCWLYLGNDNTYAPPNYYDTKEEVLSYTHSIKLEGTKEIAYINISLYHNDGKLIIDNEENENSNEHIFGYQRKFKNLVDIIDSLWTENIYNESASIYQNVLQDYLTYGILSDKKKGKVFYERYDSWRVRDPESFENPIIDLSNKIGYFRIGILQEDGSVIPIKRKFFDLKDLKITIEEIRK